MAYTLKQSFPPPPLSVDGAVIQAFFLKPE